jgi:hypothetical protein
MLVQKTAEKGESVSSRFAPAFLPHPDGRSGERKAMALRVLSRLPLRKTKLVSPAC